MRIAIDARMGHSRVGIGVYVRGLLNNLSKIDKENNYYIIINKNKREDFVPKQDNFHKIYTNVTYSDYLRRDLWEQGYLPWILYKNKVDIYHGPCYSLPIFAKVKMIITVYDMMSFKVEYYKAISRSRVQNLIKISAKRAQKIITGSENSKMDIIRILKIPEDKINVIYIGVDSEYKQVNDKSRLDSIKEKYGINKKFIQYVGSLKANKNIPRLIEAYSRLPEDILKKYALVITGGKGWKSKEIFSRVKRLGLENNVIFTGFVDDNDLSLLINAATLLVFPSLYEGFGIPPLEAMACGTPVTASNISSIPEVVGDAALLFDPYNIEEMATAMYRILIDEQLRNKLKKKGFERVKKFSWERAAKDTLKIYEEVFKK